MPSGLRAPKLAGPGMRSKCSQCLNIAIERATTAGSDKLSMSNEYKYIWIMLRNYTHHAQSPKSSVHSVHKIQGKAIRQTLKSCHIDHLLWNHDVSLTFVRGTLTNHFSVENDQCSLHDRHDHDDRRRLVVCTEEAYRLAYRGSYRTYWADMCTRLCMGMHICRQTKSISVHAHVHTLTKRICRLPQINCMHVISLTPMIRGSSAELFLFLHVASNSSAHCTKI
jgi:hypothetical protein